MADRNITDITDHLIHPAVRDQVRKLYVDSIEMADPLTRESIIDSYIDNTRSLRTFAYMDDGKVLGFSIVGHLGEDQYDLLEAFLSCDRDKMNSYLKTDYEDRSPSLKSDNTDPVIEFSDRVYLAGTLISLDEALIKYVTVVSPEHRRKGIAKRLNYFINRSFNRPIFSTCVEDNPMIHINKKAGYTHLGSIKPFYADGKGAVILGRFR
ncbi:MAG: hypothetical protein AABX19_02100 [Nanoarchaeota archaeon]